MDISYSKKKITFRAQEQKFTVKLTTSQPKQKVNYLGTGSSPPSAYQPTIEISDTESETETYISARSRVINIIEELNQREAKGQQPITRKELEDKINIWMVKCEEIKQSI